jgi:hypothetical protein
VEEEPLVTTVTCADPTVDEMREARAGQNQGEDFDPMDVAQAIWWFAADWHGDQWGSLFSAMSQCGYEPGPLELGPSHGGAIEAYSILEEVFLRHTGDGAATGK